MVKRKRNRVPHSMRGELPGEYLKRSLVEVPTDRPEVSEETLHQGAMFRMPSRNWIVTTRRFEGEFTCIVEVGGVETRMPDKVLLQIERHLGSIRKAQRSDNAVESAQRRKEAGVSPFTPAADEQVCVCKCGCDKPRAGDGTPGTPVMTWSACFSCGAAYLDDSRTHVPAEEVA